MSISAYNLEITLKSSRILSKNQMFSQQNKNEFSPNKHYHILRKLF